MDVRVKEVFSPDVPDGDLLEAHGLIQGGAGVDDLLPPARVSSSEPFGMAGSHPQGGLRPASGGPGGDQLPLFPAERRVQALKMLLGVGHAAAAGGGEGDHRFPSEVPGSPGRCPPPGAPRPTRWGSPQRRCRTAPCRAPAPPWPGACPDRSSPGSCGFSYSSSPGPRRYRAPPGGSQTGPPLQPPRFPWRPPAVTPLAEK